MYIHIFVLICVYHLFCSLWPGQVTVFHPWLQPYSLAVKKIVEVSALGRVQDITCTLWQFVDFANQAKHPFIHQSTVWFATVPSLRDHAEAIHQTLHSRPSVGHVLGTCLDVLPFVVQFSISWYCADIGCGDIELVSISLCQTVLFTVMFASHQVYWSMCHWFHRATWSLQACRGAWNSITLFGPDRVFWDGLRHSLHARFDVLQVGCGCHAAVGLRCLDHMWYSRVCIHCTLAPTRKLATGQNLLVYR